VISPEQFETILAAVRDQEFKDLLTVSWETGCRPQESLRVEARHVDRDNARWVFPASEAKGGRLPRVVYLTPEALAVTERLMVEHPAGPLFGNTDGLPWTGQLPVPPGRDKDRGPRVPVRPASHVDEPPPHVRGRRPHGGGAGGPLRPLDAGEILPFSPANACLDRVRS